MNINKLHIVAVTFIISLCFSPYALTDSSFGMGYQPKYPANFTHFDYVNPDAPKGGTLNLSAFGTFETLNPYLLKGLAALGLSPLVFESLSVHSLDEPFSVYGHLVKDMVLAVDRLSVTFVLDEKAKFSDGSPVLAKDVKATFEYLISDKGLPAYRYYYADVAGVDVLDERSVRFIFKNKNSELHLILTELPVFSPKWIGNKPFDQVVTDIPIGSGPYIVDSFAVGSYITYKRNPDYWAKDKNTAKGKFNFDQITFKYYKDDNVAREALKAGEFDFYEEGSSKSWATEYKGDIFTSGKIVVTEIPDSNNAGMQGFIFNLRRPMFQDKRVRQAISLAFDFEWSNENLFYGQYKRDYSYHSNSELAATGKPEGKELEILKELGDKVPAAVFEGMKPPYSTAAPSSIRNNLLQAKRLLDEAGWKLGADKILTNAQGLQLIIDFPVVSPTYERILAPFAQNLGRLGIKLNYRTINTSLYMRRAENFDFDMLVDALGQSLSPGNEQRDFFHSSTANVPGSRNLMGIQDPAVDALVDRVIYAKNREELIATTHALDRVLWYGEYLVPNWYTNKNRIAYWDKFGKPEKLPLYYMATQYMIEHWWSKTAK